MHACISIFCSVLCEYTAWVVLDVCLMHTCRPKWSELANCVMMLQNFKKCMFDIKTRSIIEDSELGEVSFGEVTT